MEAEVVTEASNAAVAMSTSAGAGAVPKEVDPSAKLSSKTKSFRFHDVVKHVVSTSKRRRTNHGKALDTGDSAYGIAGQAAESQQQQVQQQQGQQQAAAASMTAVPEVPPGGMLVPQGSQYTDLLRMYRALRATHLVR